MNALKNEKSRYLQQHKENPVHWYAWCKEALAKAKKEKKPIFLSIGYSSCHWCHVMAHECFEDQQVANILNENFIAIKVDKEEYPDIDSYYMDFMTSTFGAGGWPLNVFINANKDPFYAVTYIEKESFIRLLKDIAEEYKKNSDFQERQMSVKPREKTIEQEKAKGIIKYLEPKIEGAVPGPKFPQAMFLLYALEKGKKEEVETETKQLITKGLFDHIEGGWFRYTIDPYLHIPHFEKMLYDQATLLLLCATLYKQEKKKIYKYAIEKTISWLEEHMKLSTNLFASATDADTEEGEGYYYAIDKGDNQKRNALFNVEQCGEYKGKILPWMNFQLYQKHTSTSEVIIAEEKKAREKKEQPGTDTKSIMSWNCLLGYSLLKCAKALESSEIQEIAIKIAESIEMHHIKEQFYHIVYGQEPFGKQEYLEDYASYLLLLSELQKEEQIDKEKIEKTVAIIKKKFIQNGKLIYSTEKEFTNFQCMLDTPIPSGGSMLLAALNNISAEENKVIIQKNNEVLSFAAKDPTFFGLWLQELTKFYKKN